MRKTQMALAAVALVASSAALAQVTASGSVDIGVGTFNSAGAPGTNDTGLQEGAVNGGSIFTVSGSDDLGGGMKASFTLQHGFNAATGAISNGGNVGADNATFNRQANVALSGAFGTITLGNQLNAYIPGAAGTTLPGSMFGAFDVAAIVGSGEATGGGGNAGGTAPGDPTDDALTINADAKVLGATLKAGERLTYALAEGRRAYLVPAVGAVDVNGTALNARDGAAIKDEAEITITAKDDAELVMVDSL